MVGNPKVAPLILGNPKPYITQISPRITLNSPQTLDICVISFLPITLGLHLHGQQQTFAGLKALGFADSTATTMMAITITTVDTKNPA